ncbi:MAG: complex I subunit 5 family protein [Lachnospiraceae bacterium]|nr:complex I subunit 5 family protein [Lachnospiraceae bacterium]
MEQSSQGLSVLKIHFLNHGFSTEYILLTVFAAVIVLLFYSEYGKKDEHKNRFYLFSVATLASACGVFLAADFFTAFLFFELMSFTSWVWVTHRETEAAQKAGGWYLGMAVIGGMVTLMGLFLLYHEMGTLEYRALFDLLSGVEDKSFLYPAGVCIVIGFGVKAGMYPLHVWMPEAYTQAPAPASALLSGILTKTGVVGILFTGIALFFKDQNFGLFLMVMGLMTMVWGAVLGLFHMELFKILAGSSMSQIGFILTGIGVLILNGENGTMAAGGTVLHMINHTLIKLALFLIAAVLLYTEGKENTRKLHLNDIKGIGKGKPVLHVGFLLAALSVAGVPGFSGYISKTLLHESIVKCGEIQGLSVFMQRAEWIFLLSGGMTFAYMLKLYKTIFWDTPANATLKEGSRSMTAIQKVVVLVLTIPLVVLGLLPGFTMNPLAQKAMSAFFLPEEFETVSYFSVESLEGALISIGIGFVLYGIVVLGILTKKENETVCYRKGIPSWFSLKKIVYEPLVLGVGMWIILFFCRVFESIVDGFILLLRKTIYKDKEKVTASMVGHKMVELFGEAANDIQLVMNKTFLRKHPSRKNYKTIFYSLREEIHVSNRLISRSLSFGLLLVCLGVTMTLIYILFF